LETTEQRTKTPEAKVQKKRDRFPVWFEAVGGRVPLLLRRRRLRAPLKYLRGTRGDKGRI
jgi:hypothetical protein